MQHHYNARVLSSAYQLIRGEIPEPTKPGYCLQLVRLVLENAFYNGRYELYSRVLVTRVNADGRASSEPYARDLEASTRELGMHLTLPRTGPVGDPRRYVNNIHNLIATEKVLPGDLLFRWDTARDINGVFVGHVGVLLDHGLVLENVASRAEAFSRGSTKISIAGQWPITSVARFAPREEGSF